MVKKKNLKKIGKSLKKNKLKIGVGIGLFLVVFFGIYLLLPREDFGQTENILEGHFVKSKPELTVIGGESGITGIYFSIMIKNTKDVPLDVSFEEVQPSAFMESLDMSPFTLGPGEYVTITSDVMDTIQFEVGQKTFSVLVREDFTCPLGYRCTDTDTGETFEPGESGVRYESGEVTYDFQPEEAEIGSDVEFVSSTDSGSDGGVESEPETETTTTTTMVSTTTTTVETECKEICVQEDIHGVCSRYKDVCYIGQFCEFECPDESYIDGCYIENIDPYGSVMTTEDLEIGSTATINCGAGYSIEAYYYPV